MKFNSLGQYFYKLYSMIFMVMLLPLTVFIFLYKGLQAEMLLTIEIDVSPDIITFLVIGISLLDWLLMILIFRYQLRAIRKIQSLGEKLSRYAAHSIKLNLGLITGMLLLAGGYYLTENNWITLVFIMSFILPVLIWPFPKRVCNDLKLKGDEQMMVLYRMDSF